MELKAHCPLSESMQLAWISIWAVERHKNWRHLRDSNYLNNTLIQIIKKVAAKYFYCGNIIVEKRVRFKWVQKNQELKSPKTEQEFANIVSEIEWFSVFTNTESKSLKQKSLKCVKICKDLKECGLVYSHLKHLTQLAKRHKCMLAKRLA